MLETPEDRWDLFNRSGRGSKPLKRLVFHHIWSLLVVPGLRLEQCVVSCLRCFVLMLFDVVLACFAVLCWVALCFILLTMLLA